MQVLTVLRIRTPSLRTSKFELKKKTQQLKTKRLHVCSSATVVVSIVCHP